MLGPCRTERGRFGPFLFLKVKSVMTDEQIHMLMIATVAGQLAAADPLAIHGNIHGQIHMDDVVTAATQIVDEVYRQTRWWRGRLTDAEIKTYNRLQEESRG